MTLSLRRVSAGLCHITQPTHDVMITSLLRQNDFVLLNWSDADWNAQKQRDKHTAFIMNILSFESILNTARLSKDDT